MRGEKKKTAKTKKTTHPSRKKKKGVVFISRGEEVGWTGKERGEKKTKKKIQRDSLLCAKGIQVLQTRDAGWRGPKGRMRKKDVKERETEYSWLIGTSLTCGKRKAEACGSKRGERGGRGFVRKERKGHPSLENRLNVLSRRHELIVLVEVKTMKKKKSSR